MPSPEDTERQFGRIVAALLAHPDVSHGHGKKGFGENALHVRGKMFAMLTASRREFLVKLPASRVQQLIQSGVGVPFLMAGRQAREWIVVPSTQHLNWEALVNEAYLFVRGTASSPST